MGRDWLCLSLSPAEGERVGVRGPPGKRRFLGRGKATTFLGGKHEIGRPPEKCPVSA